MIIERVPADKLRPGDRVSTGDGPVFAFTRVIRSDRGVTLRSEGIVSHGAVSFRVPSKTHFLRVVEQHRGTDREACAQSAVAL